VADVVRRRSHRRHQVGQGREERWDGSLDAFACADPIVRGKRIALIDDVITTGATMAGCAAAIADAGADSIVAVAFARG
jgi:predicted amidophosphoribosyltransferase